MRQRGERMKRALAGFYGFLAQPLYLWTRPVLLLLVVPLALAISQPLWHIQLEAPQYPEGLTLDIYAYTLKGGNDGADLHEINILNHYIGMKKIERSAFADLDWLPFGFGALVLLALRVTAIGDVRSLLDLMVMAGYFAVFSGGRFIHKLWVYGHELSPDAPVKVPPFMPGVLGTKEIGNFATYSGPGLGTYLFATFLVGVFALGLLHLFEGRKRSRLLHPVLTPQEA
jgi:copper chaperone NosL